MISIFRESMPYCSTTRARNASGTKNVIVREPCGMALASHRAVRCAGMTFMLPGPERPDSERWPTICACSGHLEDDRHVCTCMTVIMYSVKGFRKGSIYESHARAGGGSPREDCGRGRDAFP